MARSCSDHALHVDRHGDHWDVVDQDGRVIAHRHSQAEAIALAIHQAQAMPEDVAVCVEQPDGHYSLAWPPR